MTPPALHPVVILGAGLAGLATAYHLSQHNYHVTVLDHPSWKDGFRTNPSDAAPMLLGCHHESHRMLQMLGKQLSSPGNQMIPLAFRLPDGRTAAYRTTRLPGAFQWMMSLLSFTGLAWRDRWKLFSHVEQIWEQAQTLPADLDNRMASEWLAAIGQSAESRDRIWDPLTHWLTGNALADLSAAIFVQLLSTVFLGNASDARLTVLQGSIAKRFLDPMKEACSHHRVSIIPLEHEPRLQFGERGLSELRLFDGTPVKAQWYILALSYERLLALLPDRLLTRYAYFAQLTELRTLPEIIVHLTYRTAPQISRLLLLTGRPFHHISVVPTGSDHSTYRLYATDRDSLHELEDNRLIEEGYKELHLLAPERTRDMLISQAVSRDQHAVLSLAPGTARLRPLQQSPLRNLLIAGAWTDTGWPANLESTLVSARRCAELITAHTA